ncbi:hypothetical protein FOS14_00840 [Skermania sp. ID1734]|uniref:DUF6542 domain-containing protein n=1 Tax=Skermania sp. ID1734 TaxID=2597516 RepID=UPI001180B361|nr:DUF6542 domain-containing protein [Skermania sp. ID1734]TSE01972.1 hypothetical protein FOS14_00840 [Skermania sp. ID1734]
MPLPQRSAIASAQGVNAGVAVLIAVVGTLIGFGLDASRGTDLTRAFSVCYFLGCLAAVLAVRYRGLFAAVVQPPLILFVAVPAAYQFFTRGSGTTVKDLLLNLAIPLVNRFPLMLVTTLVVFGVGVIRFIAARQDSAAPVRARNRHSRPAPSRRPTPAAPVTGKAAEPADTAQARRRDRQSRKEQIRKEAAAARSARRARSNPDQPSPQRRRRDITPPPGPAARQPRRDDFPSYRREPAASSAASGYPGTGYSSGYPTASGRPYRRGSSDMPAHPVPTVRYRDVPTGDPASESRSYREPGYRDNPRRYRD